MTPVFYSTLAIDSTQTHTHKRTHTHTHTHTHTERKGGQSRRDRQMRSAKLVIWHLLPTGSSRASVHNTHAHKQKRLSSHINNTTDTRLFSICTTMSDDNVAVTWQQKATHKRPEELKDFSFCPCIVSPFILICSSIHSRSSSSPFLCSAGSSAPAWAG